MDMHDQHHTWMRRIEAILKAEGIQITFLPRSEKVALHSLLVTLDRDDGPHYIHLSLIPTGDELQDVVLLQFYFEFPEYPVEQPLDRLYAGLLETNAVLPFGQLAVVRQAVIAYRAIYPLSIVTVDDESISEVFSLYNTTLDMLLDLVVLLTAGDITLEQLREQLAGI